MNDFIIRAIFRILFQLLDMSVHAGWLILFALIFRALTPKFPKRIHCLLWGMAGLRLILPFVPESAFSLSPGIENLNGGGLPWGMLGTETKKNPTDSVILFVLLFVWLFGFLWMLAHIFWSYRKLREQTSASIWVKDNVFLCDEISMPFLLGVREPKIYLPSDLPEGKREDVVLHEKAHLERKDYRWKVIGYAALSLHWFNPLVWVFYFLLCRDVEFACDEKALKSLTKPEIAKYAQTLLECTLRTAGEKNGNNKKIFMDSGFGCPLAFGEVAVQKRIQKVLAYSGDSFWRMLAGGMVCLFAAVCFLTDPHLTLKGEILLWDVLQEGGIETSVKDDRENTSSSGMSKIISWNAFPPEGTPVVSAEFDVTLHRYFFRRAKLTGTIRIDGKEFTAVPVEKSYAGMGIFEDPPSYSFWIGQGYALDSLRNTLELYPWNGDFYQFDLLIRLVDYGQLGWYQGPVK